MEFLIEFLNEFRYVQRIYILNIEVDLAGWNRQKIYSEADRRTAFHGPSSRVLQFTKYLQSRNVRASSWAEMYLL